LLLVAPLVAFCVGGRHADGWTDGQMQNAESE